MLIPLILIGGAVAGLVVNRAISHAGSEARTTASHAGSQARATVSHARREYEASLLKTRLEYEALLVKTRREGTRMVIVIAITAVLSVATIVWLVRRDDAPGPVSGDAPAPAVVAPVPTVAIPAPAAPSHAPLPVRDIERTWSNPVLGPLPRTDWATRRDR